MEITIAKTAGFCFGVKHALKIADQAAKSGAAIDMLGDIVHNEIVVHQISKSGIRKISQLRKGKNRTLLIRAHGASKKIHEKAQSLGYTIIDATCPMVKEIHKIAEKAESQGYPIIVIGDQLHDEVKGIIGQLKKKPIMIDSLNSIPYPRIKKLKKAAIVVQSTRNLEKTIAIVETLEKIIPEVKFFNTICHPTRTKQKEMQTMPLNNDVMIIVGSKTSANTKRLYELAKSLNKKTYWINSEMDIKSIWFKGIKKVGITSGASTPETTTKAVAAKINFISSQF